MLKQKKLFFFMVVKLRYNIMESKCVWQKAYLIVSKLKFGWSKFAQNTFILSGHFSTLSSEFAYSENLVHFFSN